MADKLPQVLHLLSVCWNPCEAAKLNRFWWHTDGGHHCLAVAVAAICVNLYSTRWKLPQHSPLNQGFHVPKRIHNQPLLEASCLFSFLLAPWPLQGYQSPQFRPHSQPTMTIQQNACPTLHLTSSLSLAFSFGFVSLASLLSLTSLVSLSFSLGLSFATSFSFSLALSLLFVSLLPSLPFTASFFLSLSFRSFSSRSFSFSFSFSPRPKICFQCSTA